MQLFGKNLFNFKKEPGQLYDFAKFGLLNNFGRENGFWGDTPVVINSQIEMVKNVDEKPKTVEKPRKTPKEIYNLKSLNDNDFKIRCDEDYLTEQLETIRIKLDYLGKKPKEKKSRRDEIVAYPELGGVRFGREELESIKQRLENRRKIETVKETLDKYPHTSTQLIGKVLSENSHLRAEVVGTFVPDLPRVAIKAMKEYDQMCISLCNKKAVFYIIADRKDFEEVSRRRDPILLAQSPFGHFWQILGAWDEEMIFLGDL